MGSCPGPPASSKTYSPAWDLDFAAADSGTLPPAALKAVEDRFQCEHDWLHRRTALRLVPYAGLCAVPAAEGVAESADGAVRAVAWRGYVAVLVEAAKLAA